MNSISNILINNTNMPLDILNIIEGYSADLSGEFPVIKKFLKKTQTAFRRHFLSNVRPDIKKKIKIKVMVVGESDKWFFRQNICNLLDYRNHLQVAINIESGRGSINPKNRGTYLCDINKQNGKIYFQHRSLDGNVCCCMDECECEEMVETFTRINIGNVYDKTIRYFIKHLKIYESTSYSVSKNEFDDLEGFCLDAL